MTKKVLDKYWLASLNGQWFWYHGRGDWVMNRANATQFDSLQAAKNCFLEPKNVTFIRVTRFSVKYDKSPWSCGDCGLENKWNSGWCVVCSPEKARQHKIQQNNSLGREKL